MKTDWSKYRKIGLPDTTAIIEMAVHLTTHATDRATTRDGRPVGLTREKIQNIIDSVEDKIIELGSKSATIILKTQDAINIVGSLSQQAGHWVFDVITIMIKKNFVPKNSWDKVVYVKEAQHTIHTLISIIDRIENQRLVKMERLDELAVGTKVKYQRSVGIIIEVSPKLTSVIVEFEDKSQKRFFMNKRKNHESLSELIAFIEKK